MALGPDIYAADPAYPILACSLFAEPESMAEHAKQPSSEERNDDQWNLQEDWNAGIQPTKRGVLHSGKVIGFSRLKSNSNDDNEYIAQICRHLITKHLLRGPPTPDTKVFIVYPSNFDAFAPVALLNSLHSTCEQPGLSREDAIRLLDSVQLLPVFDLQHAGQAISKVSESMQDAKERRQQQHQQLLNLEKPGNADRHPILLFVAGLDTLAEGVIRNSNPAKGTAVLAAILRILNRMARVHLSDLSVVLVNTNGLGATHIQPPGSTSQPNIQDEDSSTARDDGVHSIFQTPGPPLLSNLLMRTLDQGIDTHILLSDVKSVQVAEVIKDRAGAALGKWGVWSRQQ